MTDAAVVTAASTNGRPPIDASVARGFDAVEALRARWERFSFQRVDADIDFFTTFASTSPKVVRPHVVSFQADGAEAMVVGRLEQTRLATSLGYKTLYEPEVRLLVVAHGGLTGAGSDELSRASVGELRAALRRGEADAALLPAVRTSSPLYRAAREVPFLERQHFATAGTHWALELPESFDSFLKSRSKKTRENARVYRNRLHREFGDRITLEVLATPDEIDRIFTDLPTVARHTYQSGLGVAFADTAVRRELVGLGLDRRWFRAYVMYLDGKPIAFWPGTAYGRTFYVGTPGYDPAYAQYSIGTILLLHVVEHLCADSAVDVLDYGFGDSEYKRRFGTTSWEEADVLLFAPTSKGIRVNLARTALLAGDRLARSVLERSGLARELKRRWRRRLRPA
jgi:CelD/BcsL family acetyltransferase involved in cellulose biosynthesis